MIANDRRLLLDQRFERAIETVLGAFLAEGFTIRVIDGGDLHRCGACGSLRYAVLEASLPELCCVTPETRAPRSMILACEVSLFELIGERTLVTAGRPVSDYPFLALLVPRLARRVNSALRSVANRATMIAAA